MSGPSKAMTKAFQRLILLVWLAPLLPTSVPARAALELRVLSSPAVDSPGRAPAPGAARSRRVGINPLLLEEQAALPGDRLIIEAFSGLTVEAVVDRVAQDVNGTRIVQGRGGAGRVVFSVSDRKLLGSISLPETGQELVIRYIPELNGYVVEELDPRSRDELPDAPALDSGPARDKPSDRKSISSALRKSDPARVDVMIVYTPEARNWAEDNAGGIHNLIALAMQRAQEASENSNAQVVFRLVKSAETDYVESGSYTTDLLLLQVLEDGSMDEVHGWRDDYGADLVVLFEKINDVGGAAYQLADADGEPESAFAIVRVQQAHTAYTHAHEMGHLMGCGHRKDHDGPGLFSYSAGWRWIATNSTRYCSVMSYPDAWEGQPVYTVGHFSNPDILYLGGYTGHAADGDNARTLREIKDVVAGYRSEVSRPIRLTGDLHFGTTPVGQTDCRTLTIHNDGEHDLIVHDIAFPAGFSGWGSGLISAGDSNDVTVAFSPTNAGAHGGTLTVYSDANEGLNTLEISGTGVVVPPFYVAITNPPSDLQVPSSTTVYVVQGRRGTSVVGRLVWTNLLTGGWGTIYDEDPWNAGGLPLATGTNVIVVAGTNRPIPAVLASDSATNSVYNDGWQNYDNGGFGLDAWALNLTGPNAGHFIATVASNPNLDIGPRAWGLWANNGDIAEAFRYFENPLSTGQTLRVIFENNYIESGRSAGVALQNDSGNTLVEFFFLGGNSRYTISDRAGERDSGVAYASNGLALAFGIRDADTYRLDIGAHSITGMLKTASDMAPARFRVWNYSAGSGGDFNVYLSELTITNVAKPSSWTSDTATIVREAALPPMIVTRPASGAGGAFVIGWSVVPDRTYDVLYSTNLCAPGGGFLPLGTNLTAASFTDLVHAAESMIYYRLRVNGM